MAKRELSSTLKNLKFMQRATQKEEKAPKEEEVITAGDFPCSSTVKRCVVIVEGDPHPGATRGRMSFLSFNPSIDRLNEEASNISQSEPTATSSGSQRETTPVRENGSSKIGLQNTEALSNDANVDFKRKQADVVFEASYPNKSPKNSQDSNAYSPSSSHISHKKHKREKLDWKVLRPPRHESRKR